MDNQSKRILITGATGFVGSYLTRLLVKKGYKNIVCLKRATSRMDLVAEVQDKVTWAEGDIFRRTLFEKYTKCKQLKENNL